MKERALTTVWLAMCVVASAASHPIPFVDQPVVPTAAARGGAAFTLQLAGTGFVSDSMVRWNGKALATTFLSGTKLKAAVPAALLEFAGVASISVINPAPGGGASNAVFFPVYTPTPTVVLPGYATLVNGNPESVITADFNGDGKLDIAALSLQVVTVLLGRGDGTFQAPVNYPLFTGGQQAQTFTAGDFNGDGKLDLAIGSTTGVDFTGILYLLTGNGDGTFQPSKTPTYALPNVPSALAASDLNGDGKLDLVIGYSEGSAVSVALGIGDGTFGPRADYDTGQGPASLVLADLNNDGKIDIATADMFSSTACCSILLGNGDGTFATAVDVGPESFPGGITAADFNGDGNIDLAVSNAFYETILLGNGDGTFQAGSNAQAGGFVQASAVSADVNGDGRLDLVVSSNGIAVMLGNGDGTFQPPLVAIVPGLVGSLPGVPALGDFNQDGLLDVVTSSGGDSVSFLIQSILQVSPGNVRFNRHIVGSATKPQTITLSNFGLTAFDLSGIAVTGSNPADFPIRNECPASLQPGGSCPISVKFDPTAIDGRSAVLCIPDSMPGMFQSVGLSGLGTIVKVTGPLNFGNVPVGHTSPPQTITVTNAGHVELRVSRIRFNPSEDPDFTETDNCGSPIAPGGFCSIMVSFTPQATGLRSNQVVIVDDGGGSPQRVRVQGNGI
jgi:hypothetical protein